MMSTQFGDWDFDVLRLNSLVKGQALSVVFTHALKYQAAFLSVEYAVGRVSNEDLFHQRMRLLASEPIKPASTRTVGLIVRQRSRKV